MGVPSRTKQATLTENYELLYIENSERYDAGLNGSQIGNRPWAVNSLGYRVPTPTPNGEGCCPPENFVHLYLENGERYDGGLNGSQIGNRPGGVHSSRSGHLLTPEGKRRRTQSPLEMMRIYLTRYDAGLRIH